MLLLQTSSCYINGLKSQEPLYGKSYGCIVGGRIGGVEGMADRVVRDGIRDGLGVSVAFKFMTCPFLYTVKVMLFPAILF